jgi:hypothetical protein
MRMQNVNVRYRAWVHSRDKRRWEVKERWRRWRDEEAGGCIRQQVADALWELSGQYDVGVWYEYRWWVCGSVITTSSAASL